jgi:uncharacterized membrane protein
VRPKTSNRQLSESAGRPASLRRSKLLGLTFVFLWFLIGGIAHFAVTDLEMRIMPPYIPWPHAAVLASGWFELLGAAGLLYQPTRRAAGVGLFALTISVTPANIYMLQRADLFAVPYWVLVLRLPLQVALLALIWWSTIRSSSPSITA